MNIHAGLRYLTVIIVLAFLSGCTVNPVTGEKQLSLIPESQELSIGSEQYKPTQQTQGGQFYLDPDLNQYVSEVGQKLAKVSDRPDLPYEFVVLNSSVPNAWALPGGKIAINRGLLTELEDEAQLASILGHEIVHAAARHSVQRMQQGMLISAGVAGLGFALSDNEWAGLIMGGAAMGAQLALAQYSQGDELESDHYGIRYMKEAGYDPQAAVELQEIFVRLSEGRNTSFIEGMFATHPPSQKRVNENQELVNKIGAGGYRGKDEYQKKLSFLRDRQPAYNAHDEALKLASDDKLDQALAKVNEAIRIEPEEAAFYSLRGRIYRAQDNEKKAEADFDRATSLYPEMFTYQLHSGLNALELNKLDKAKERLNKANEAVPTSIAFLRLGDIAVQQKRRDDAIQYYSTAAKAEGQIAQEAKQKLAQLTQS
ncbi:tetratricopeptide repeat protein [Marinobacter panjinensis]|uniref:Tetratricopeptide repeat protein n=1 Tax=Marinobacter panjinensis TaxID=2576384 RepID=A0A4U6QZF3_9GAMM|nr:M48 family metalloprotease [Marinobacter panjinensis]MCR8915464.1 M48 family metalloprotease [Marinobacter panjinensis]TKV66717.1 tetratricopeptide repeat protein [Marinobacter panjinensis]